MNKTADRNDRRFCFVDARNFVDASVGRFVYGASPVKSALVGDVDVVDGSIEINNLKSAQCCVFAKFQKLRTLPSTTPTKKKNLYISRVYPVNKNCRQA